MNSVFCFCFSTFVSKKLKMMQFLILLGIMGGPELIIIGLVLVVLFGSKRIPKLMRDLGTGLREVKKVTEENALAKDIKDISSEINDVSSGIKDMTSPTRILKKKQK
jgi:sec-independent protein translocase protein TatA